MTERQARVREFVDEAFPPGADLARAAAGARAGIASADWEERSAAYNAARRLFRYAPAALADDDVHAFATAILDEMGSSQTALVLAALAALAEAFRGKPASMEFELARLAPVLLPLHQKTAQFFEAALAELFDAIVQAVSVKKFLAVMIANADARGSKVQAAIARYCRDSLAKQAVNGEKMFAKGTNEAADLVRLVGKALAGAATETRNAGREAARLLAQYYGDAFPTLVQRALGERPAADLLRAV
jgi:hypothetical protein